MLNADGTYSYPWQHGETLTAAALNAAIANAASQTNIVTPADFGAKGDGITDDTAAVQAALNAIGPGGVVSLDGMICLTGNLTVPANVVLRGHWEHPGLQWNPAVPPNQYLSLYDRPSQIILKPNTSITMGGNAAAVVGLIISRQGLSFPAHDSASLATLLGQFNGTALMSSWQDTCFRNLLLIGHTRGIDLGVSAASDRHLIEYVFGDCTNGIRVNGSYDLSRINFCHFWPYVTFNVPGATSAQFARAGIAFEVTSCDWEHLTDCFAFGWSTNYKATDASALTFTACHSDGPGVNTPYGWYIQGKSDPVVLQGCGGNNAATMLYIGATVPINPGQTPTAVRSTGCRFAPSTTGVEVTTGWYASIADTFESGTNGIIGDSGSSGRIVASLFRNNITHAFSVANPTSWDVISATYGSGTTAPELSTITGGLQVYQQLAVQGGGTFTMAQTGNPTDQNNWMFNVLGGGTGTLNCAALNDAGSASTSWLAVTRTGYVPQTITLTAPHVALGSGLTNAANDAAAASAGIAVNGLYRNGSVVQIRVT